MKILYECEVCGRQFADAIYAAYCESFVMLPSKYLIGDEIAFETRYDGIEKDIIIGINVVQTPYWPNPECMSIQHKLDYLGQAPHTYQYTVSKNHQLGKDCWSNEILEE